MLDPEEEKEPDVEEYCKIFSRYTGRKSTTKDESCWPPAEK